MNVKEIEIAVTELSPTNLNEFASWFDKYQEKLWDNQIENDVNILTDYVNLLTESV